MLIKAIPENMFATDYSVRMLCYTMHAGYLERVAGALLGVARWREFTPEIA